MTPAELADLDQMRADAFVEGDAEVEIVREMIANFGFHRAGVVLVAALSERTYDGLLYTAATALMQLATRDETTR